MGARAIEIGEVGRTVAHNIKLLRDARGLTQTDMSARMRALGRPLMQTGIGAVELGTRRVDVADLVAFARALDVLPSDLLEPLRVRPLDFPVSVEQLRRAVEDVQRALAATVVTVGT